MFIDRDRWLASRLDRGDLYMVRRLFEDAGNAPDAALAAKLLAATERGLADQRWRDDRSQAVGLRLKGEILEATGAIKPAIESYDKAIALNPKIGIKRRV
ncbi:MAG: tetratricopeptide repeat protein [Caulobacteraceae bacterium]